MKKQRKNPIYFIISILLMSNILTLTASGQSTDFSGRWSYNHQVSISGKLYQNGSPEKVAINQKGKNIEVESVTFTGTKDTTTREIFDNNNEFITRTVFGRRKVITLQWADDGNGFTETTNVYSLNESGKVDGQIIDIWTKADGLLTLDRKSKNFIGGDEWESKAYYVLGENEINVNFQTGLSWQQILEQAKEQNKYIFVDCFATWCVPCKQMDQEVYTDMSVSDILNAKFISVRMQIDSTAKDDQQTKARYADATFIRNTYSVSAFPTFLFFSPNGQLVHQGIGYMPASDFINLVTDATDTSTQYFTELRKYKEGTITKDELPYLAINLKKYGNLDSANKIAANYKLKYLDNANDQELIATRNLKFIAQFDQLVKDSSDSYFKLFYNHRDKVDSTVWGDNTGFGRGIVGRIIQTEQLDNKLYLTNGKPVVKNPDWGNLELSLNKFYSPEFSSILIMRAKFIFYQKTADWNDYADLVNGAIKKFPPKFNGHNFGIATQLGAVFSDDCWALNSVAWNVFKHCNNKGVLTMALNWIDMAIPMSPEYKKTGSDVEYADTKANLLYKIGRKKEAIIIEKAAYHLSIVINQKRGVKGGDQSILQSLIKMQKGQPTWVAS